MLRTIIVDDEVPVRDMLNAILEQYCNMVEVVGFAQNVAKAVELIPRLKAELVLLDINLPDGSGFDVLSRLQEPLPHVIFVTAYNEYAIKAFKYNAIDYILKPVNIDDLINAIQKVVEKQDYQSISIKLKNLFENLEKSPAERKIILKTQESIHIVKISNIIRCESDHNYTMFYLDGGRKVLVSKTLKEYDDLLHGDGFLRTHQSHLINLNYLSSFEKNDGGYLKMSDGSIVPVSNGKREELLELLDNM